MSDFSVIFEREEDERLIRFDDPGADVALLFLFPAASAALVYALLTVLFSSLATRDLFDVSAVVNLTTTAVLIALPLMTLLMSIYLFRGRDYITHTEKEISRRLRAVQQSSEASTIQNSSLAQKDLDEINFARNIHNMPQIESFRIRNHIMFADLRWELNERVNVLLGRNGYGKSLLLRMLVAMLSNDARMAEIIGASSKGLEAELHLSAPEKAAGEAEARAASEEEADADISYRQRTIRTIAPVPLLAIPEIRSLNRSRSLITTPEDDHENIARFGYHNFLYDSPIDSLVQRMLFQCCIEYLTSKSSDPNSVPLLALIARVITQLSGNTFAFHAITPIGAGKFRIEVITEAHPQPVALQVASQGTLSVVAIFGLIYEYLRRIAEANRLPRVEDAPGIVVIDELDAHLHPAWQRTILDLLRHTFPRVQFICTAHSPLVVAGCLENEVGVLRRNESETAFEIDNIYEHFIGWSPERILTKVFDVEGEDLSFSRYSAMAPQRRSIEAQVERLKSRRDSLSAEETETLARLSKDLDYIESAQKAHREAYEISALRDEIKELRIRLEKAEGASARSAELS